MSLLHEIQGALLDGNSKLAPILLKVRFIAAKLGSIALEEWVKHETEGYPKELEVPSYRIIQVSFRGTFSGPFGSGVNNAPIPAALITQYAGDHWVNHRMRQSVASIDSLVEMSSKGDGGLQLDASNLILLLQGKVYEDFACNSVSGLISESALVEIQNAVRARLLELTLALEKSIPDVASIRVGTSDAGLSQTDITKVTQISNQVIHGNYTSIINSGDNNNFTFNTERGSVDSVVDDLRRAGILETDAKAFGEILASEKPESKAEPFGARARDWIEKNIGKAVNGTWKAGVAVATNVLTEVALRYYGLK